MKKRFRRPKEFEEVEYEPTSLKTLLTQMKDDSELIIDLAYGSLVFDSSEMAGQVETIEKRMDRSLYQIRIAALMASRTKEEAESISGLLQVAKAAENISNAAGDMAKVSRQSMDTRPFLPFLLKDADEVLASITVQGGSSMVGKTLGELDFEEATRTALIAHRRRKHWRYDPGDEICIKEGDYLIVRGVPESIEEIMEYADGKKVWPFPVKQHGGGE